MSSERITQQKIPKKGLFCTGTVFAGPLKSNKRITNDTRTFES